jgi:folate-binding protein YgfZ
MEKLVLHQLHERLGAQFTALNDVEVVHDYGNAVAEHAALRETAGVLDLSFRGRLCLTGADRVRFLHGQVTNDIKRLASGEGCYAALVTSKGRMQSDLNVYSLPDELLLDFEPGLRDSLSQRLGKFIVADDVEVVDIAPMYGLLSLQGPKSAAVVQELGLFELMPAQPFQFLKREHGIWGEVYCMNQPRLGRSGFDLFVPIAGLETIPDKLLAAAHAVGGRVCGWRALEMARIEAGIARFGADMDETNFPQECGIEARAVSYAKGCYIGQEVLNRIHTLGHVNRQLRGLRLADELESLPVKGDKLFYEGKEAGYITSALASPTLKANIALGYVRKEADRAEAELVLRSSAVESMARIVELPFQGDLINAVPAPGQA